MVLLTFIGYQLLQLIALPFLLILLVVRRYKGKTTIGSLRQRLGFVPLPPKEKPAIWCHGVSVGEVVSLEWVTRSIKRIHPKASSYLTSGTASSQRVAVAQQMADRVSFVPFDFLLPVIIAFVRIRPRALIIAEAELWPNLLIVARLFRVPCYLVNARINPPSFARYQRARWFFTPLLNLFEHIYVQSEGDYERFTKIGVETSRLKVVESTKLLTAVAKQESLAGTLPPRTSNAPTLLVGSFHPGELPAVLKLISALRAIQPTLKVILAPRHLGWQEELCKGIATLGLPTALVRPEESFFSPTGEQLGQAATIAARTQKVLIEEIASWIEKADITIVATIGTLFATYRYADLFLLGGTFVPVGGHNVVEPAIWGLASLVGPFHANCKAMSDELVKANGALYAPDEESLIKEGSRLIGDLTLCRAMGANGRSWVLQRANGSKEALEQLIRNVKI